MKRVYNHKTVIKMHDDGALQREIAERTGYSLTAVKKILCANGRTRKRDTGQSYRCPIYPIEIARYRERLQIGQKKTMHVQICDENLGWKMTDRVCTVSEKHRHIFVALDANGRRRTGRYVDMIIRDREERGCME